MDRSSTKFAVLILSAFAAFGVLFFANAVVPAQKAEHYNSPLYSPKYYDPSESTGNGLPDALQKIGIDQKLGDQLPLPAPPRQSAESSPEHGRMHRRVHVLTPWP